jgi:hypothetical protein
MKLDREAASIVPRTEAVRKAVLGLEVPPSTEEASARSVKRWVRCVSIPR